MKQLLTGISALSLLALSNSGFADDAPAPAAPPAETGPLAIQNFSATLSFTTQYMFRGVSNSDGPAIQGSFDWTYDGLFLGAWSSNTEFSDGHFELDVYGGYRWSWQNLDWTLQGIYYTYPGEDSKFSDGFDPIKVSPNYAEVNIGVSHTFQGQLAPTVGLNYFYSPDTFGEDGRSHTVIGNFGLTLPAAINAYASVGYTDIHGNKSTGSGTPFGIAIGGAGYDYVFFQVGVNKVFKGFKFDLSFVGTDKSKSLEAFYPNGPAPALDASTSNVFALPGSKDNWSDLIDRQIVFSVSRTF